MLVISPPEVTPNCFTEKYQFTNLNKQYNQTKHKVKEKIPCTFWVTKLPPWV